MIVKVSERANRVAMVIFWILTVAACIAFWWFAWLVM